MCHVRHFMFMCCVYLRQIVAVLPTSWHINHDPLNDCLPSLWPPAPPPPLSHSTTHQLTHSLIAPHLFPFSITPRTFGYMQILQIVCLLACLWSLHMEIGKVFTRWPRVKPKWKYGRSGMEMENGSLSARSVVLLVLCCHCVSFNIHFFLHSLSSIKWTTNWNIPWNFLANT